VVGDFVAKYMSHYQKDKKRFNELIFQMDEVWQKD